MCQVSILLLYINIVFFIDLMGECKPLNESIAAYLSRLLPTWEEDCSSFDHVGSPVLIVINPSAIRAVNFNRFLLITMSKICFPSCSVCLE